MRGIAMAIVLVAIVYVINRPHRPRRMLSGDCWVSMIWFLATCVVIAGGW